MEFCLLQWTAVNGSYSFQVLSIIVRLCTVVLLWNLELCKGTKSYFLLCQKRRTALKYLLIFHQNTQKQNGSKCINDNKYTTVLCLHKSRRKRNPNEMTDYFVCTANAHAWMSPARTIWKNTRLIMALNQK